MVQAKRSSESVDVEDIQQVVAGMIYYGCS